MLSQGMIKSTGRVLWNNDHLSYYRLEQNTVFTSLILIKYETGPKRVFFINFETLVVHLRFLHFQLGPINANLATWPCSIDR